ncbi:MAG: hypothetical protein AB7L71_16140 [Vicinamibacterales bacterium]|jgi:hypothetical protein
MFAGWQDIVVTVIAAGAALVVVWRTAGHWQQSRPAKSGCDHCLLANEEMRK